MSLVYAARFIEKNRTYVEHGQNCSAVICLIHDMWFLFQELIRLLTMFTILETQKTTAKENSRGSSQL